MAGFTIFEDENITSNTIKIHNLKLCNDKSKIKMNRMALMCLDNGMRRENKRIKYEEKDNSPIQFQKKRKDNTIKIGKEVLKLITNSKGIGLESDLINNHLFKLNEWSNEYCLDILKYYIDIENMGLPRKNYMGKQTQINWNMRSILIDWFVLVTEEYRMSQETLYLGVNYVDRFLSKIEVLQRKLQLVGVSAMLIASKIEEIYPPPTKEWMYLTKNTFQCSEIKCVERLILKVLNFELHPPTIYTFLKHLCNIYETDKITTNFAQYLSELSLNEGDIYLNFKPSEIAASSLLLAQLYTMNHNIGVPRMQSVCFYTLDHLSPIIQILNRTLANAYCNNCLEIKKKYEKSKYESVALIMPKYLNPMFFDQKAENSNNYTFLENIQLEQLFLVKNDK